MTPPRSRNQPVKVHWEDRTTRILNLLITLTDSPKARSTSWIGTHIKGYEGSADTKRKQLERDRALLTDLGVRFTESIRTDDQGQTEKLFAIDTASSFLADIPFTPGQWDAISAAGRWAVEPALAEALHAAIEKLQPSSPRGIPAALVPIVSSVPDSTDLTDQDVQVIHHAVNEGLQLRFNYWPHLTADPQERTVEPWGVAAVDGRLFLTGFDVDRQAQRTFRLARIADVELREQWRQAPVPDIPIRTLVRRGLEAASTLVSAQILFRTNGAQELRQRKTGPAQAHPDGDVFTIGPVDRNWIIRTAAAYAPDAIVLSPPDVVTDVVAHLERAASLLNAGVNKEGE